LVYGAGVIGSIFAYTLKSGGIDTSILARGKRLEDLREYGLIIQDDIFKKEYKTKIKVVDKLEKDDYYDIILVIMQRQQVSQVLPILKENVSPNIIFTGNNPTGAEEYLNFFEKERILLGFGGPGGYRQEHKIIAAYVDQAILYVGELDNTMSERLKVIEREFTKAGMKVDLIDNIDAWLKCHAALISPLACGTYAARNRNTTLGKDRELVNLAIKGMKESIKALKDLKIPILPKKFRKLSLIPTSIIRKKLINLTESDFGRIALSGHANAAKGEMKRLTDDFYEIIKAAKIELNAFQKLYDLSFGLPEY
jgi:2-dehydropantoate 2-reductase